MRASVRSSPPSGLDPAGNGIVNLARTCTLTSSASNNTTTSPHTRRPRVSHPSVHRTRIRDISPPSTLPHTAIVAARCSERVRRQYRAAPQAQRHAGPPSTSLPSLLSPLPPHCRPCPLPPQGRVCAPTFCHDSRQTHRATAPLQAAGALSRSSRHGGPRPAASACAAQHQAASWR
jgi:hypothetical protein